MTTSFNDNYVNINVNINNINNTIEIKGTLKNASSYKNKKLIAPNTYDKIASYSGSYIPFPNFDIATENTKNSYEIPNNGSIETVFSYPNSYYSEDGYTKIKSPIILIIDDLKMIYELEDKYPLKTIRDRVRGDPSFYALKDVLLPVATAEETMYNYMYAKFKYNIA
jgi:hypothetical protein